MADPADDERLRRWRREATDGLAEAIRAAPGAAVPAYDGWEVADLALHVVRVCGNAAIALRSGSLERPSPEVGIDRGDDPAALAEAVGEALAEAEAALEACEHAEVWTPVGPRSPAFWARRLLREAVLHRFDAEQAAGAADAPEAEVAVELIDECCATDVVRALAADDRPDGAVTLSAGRRTWTVDMARGAVEVDVVPAAATISGDPAAVWLWLMRREGLPGEVAVDDPDGGARAFAGLLDGLSRPRA